ncbi:BTAD domain-containing putative transcriptional regulator [Solwaraspora sp. WMMB762]|uniref:AfsR/SARP family transcriptional regulator n=1 Tax=Solwaraspora sp. WMMB762 TaxID=3404120 RepID=UPI003B953B51
MGGPRSQRLLAAMLLNANRPVSVDALIAAAWDGDPPRTARRQVLNRIAGLRATLTRAGGTVDTRTAGYLLRVAPEQVDALAFDSLVRQAATAPDDARSVSMYRQALALWRGPALAGLRGGFLETEAAGLDERRLCVHADCIERELARGEADRLVPELRRLVAEHPFRERFAGLLITTLTHAGRRAEALDAYRELRERLVSELGFEPSAALQALHQAALRDAPASTAAASQPAPRQQPRDVPTFTGRHQELATIRRLFGTGTTGPVAVVAVQGVGGIGKSALAVHAAHRFADRFPDGVLYADLRGATAGLAPVSPLDALHRFLRALDAAPVRLPMDVDEAAAMFRSAVADLRLLVVLDNARDAAQVAPLLPGGGGCGVIVTSRRMLSTLDGAHHIQLEPLTEQEGLAQLTGTVGNERIAADPQAARELVRWCGRFPLALRIAGARLAAHSGWTVRDFAARLADEQRRLDELEVADLSVRASIALSHRKLRGSADPVDRDAATAIATLSIWDGPDVSDLFAARLMDRPPTAAARALDRLVDASLLDSEVPGRYHHHDLIRLYGREQATISLRGAERAAALTRAIGWYVGTVWGTYPLLRPGDRRPQTVGDQWTGDATAFPDPDSALRWLDDERSNHLVALHQAAANPAVPASLVVQLGQGLYAFHRVRNSWGDVSAINSLVLEVAARSDDNSALAVAHTDMGAALCQLERFDEAAEHLRTAIARHRAIGDRHGHAQALALMGNVHQAEGRSQEALMCYQACLAVNEELGDLRGQAMNLGNLGLVWRLLGRYDEAQRAHERGMALFRELGDRYGQAIGLTNLASLYRDTERYDAAVTVLQECLETYRSVGDRFGQAKVHLERGMVRRLQQRYQEALADQRTAAAALRELGRRQSLAESLRESGLILHLLGQFSAARHDWQEALGLFLSLGIRSEAAQVRRLLAPLDATTRPA